MAIMALGGIPTIEIMAASAALAAKSTRMGQISRGDNNQR